MKPRVPFASSSVESLSRQVGPGLSTIFLWLTASARWVLLGPHLFLRKDIKRVGSHGCRTASLFLTQMATWQGTSTAGCAQTLSWIAAHYTDTKAVLSAYHTSDNILRISNTCHAFSCTSTYAHPHRPRDHGGGQRQNMLQKVLELSSLVTFQIPGWIIPRVTPLGETESHLSLMKYRGFRIIENSEWT